MLPHNIEARRSEIFELANRFGMRNVRLCGTASGRSDVDFIVQVRPGHSLLDLLGFEEALESLLECPVDVVSENGLPPTIYRDIQRDWVPL